MEFSLRESKILQMGGEKERNIQFTQPQRCNLDNGWTRVRIALAKYWVLAKWITRATLSLPLLQNKKEMRYVQINSSMRDPF